MSDTAARVLGWDLLRGVGAGAVAFYHLSYWMGLSELPALGTYSVYLFFVLSGASLAYTYPRERLHSAGDALRFLATRWMRLAPLYLLLCGVFVAMLSLRNGTPPGELPLRFALNASFGFGLYDPAIWALLIGGWSLGIEFVFYLAFPVISRILPQPGLAWPVLLLLVVLQFSWIAGTVGTHGWAPAVADYHQVPAFVAYFFGGCMLGHWQRGRLPAGPAWLAWGSALAWVGLLLLLMPQRPGEELLGLRGAVLFVACFVAAWLSGQARLATRSAHFATWAGDATYGLYLLHPILFFGIAWFVALPLAGAEPHQWPMPARWLLLAVVIAVACGLAALSERRLERPLRRWSRRRLQAA